MPRRSELERLEYQTISLSDHSATNQARIKPFWPHDVRKMKRLLLREQEDAVRHGVVVRVGKELILNVPAYLSWLATYSKHVIGYQITPNSPEHFAKKMRQANSSRFAPSKARAAAEPA